MGMAPVAHVMFNKFMSFNPKNPDWLNRDRFILSYVLAPTTHLRFRDSCRGRSNAQTTIL